MYDAIVIGGGPAGLSAALFLGRALRKVLLFDDARPRNAAALAIHGFLGHDGIDPRGLREAGRREIARYGVEVVAERIVRAESTQPHDTQFATQFQVWAARGESVRARKLLLATGVVDELPDIPGVRECYGVSVHHCPYCDGWEHRGKPLFVIAGCAEDAVGLAMSLHAWSRDLVLLANGMAIAEDDQARLRRRGIAWRQERVARLLHHQGALQAVELIGGQPLPGRALFFAGRQRQASDLAVQLGCWLDDEQHASSGKRQRTPVPGLFLAGDVDGDVQFAVVAAAEGATAAVALNKELQEEDNRLAADWPQARKSRHELVSRN